MITFNKDPLSVVQLILNKVKPTKALAIALAESQRSRILERTAKGKDFNDQPFAEYSTNGPVYYYPAGRASGRTIKSKRESASRLFKKLTGKSAKAHTGKKKALSSSAGEAWATPGGGLGFSSYGALKKWAGRNNVDLRGLRAPHMLQATQTPSLDDSPKIGAYAIPGGVRSVIGIYGEAAGRAQGHNLGSKHLPQRKFLAASKKDERKMKVEVDEWLGRQVSKL